MSGSDGPSPVRVRWRRRDDAAQAAELCRGGGARPGGGCRLGRVFGVPSGAAPSPAGGAGARQPDPRRSGPDAAPGWHLRVDRGRHQARRDQHQHGVSRSRAPGPDAVRGVFRGGVLPALLRRGARANPTAQPGLGCHRRSDRDRAHQCARGRQGHRDRGGDPRRRQASGEGHRRGQEDRPRRAQARRRQGLVQVRPPG